MGTVNVDEAHLALLRKKERAHDTTSRGRIGTSTSGTRGGFILAIGVSAITSSFTHHRKNAWQPRYRLLAVASLNLP